MPPSEDKILTAVDMSYLLIFTQLPKQTFNQLLHHNQRFDIERKAAVVVTQTNLMILFYSTSILVSW
jgi:hypothetical protein